MARLLAAFTLVIGLLGAALLSRGGVPASAQGMGAWTIKQPMPTGRWQLAAGEIGGLIYAAGGYNASTSVSTLHVYNPATDSWATGPALPAARHTGGYGVIGDVLYLAGGLSGGAILSSVVAYDASAGSWSTVASLPSPRYHLAAGVVGGILYA